MTGQHPADCHTLDGDQFAQRALAHFECEEAFLDSLHEQLQEIHTALLNNDQPELYRVLQRQSELEPWQAALRQERAGLCQRAAAILGVAVEDIHLGRLAEHLSGEPARQLERQRRRLEEKLQETDQVRQRIASLTHYCLSFLQDFFRDLTGGDAGRYSPTGSRSDSACGSFIEARG